MSNIIFVILCLATGMILRKTNRLPENTSSALNGFIIHLSLPALTLIHIHSLKMDWIYLFPALMPWFFSLRVRLFLFSLDGGLTFRRRA